MCECCYDRGISMAVKMPSPTLKKECAAILESMKVWIILLHFIVIFAVICL